jgi:hypothetical protein
MPRPSPLMRQVRHRKECLNELVGRRPKGGRKGESEAREREWKRGREGERERGREGEPTARGVNEDGLDIVRVQIDARVLRAEQAMDRGEGMDTRSEGREAAA